LFFQMQLVPLHLGRVLKQHGGGGSGGGGGRKKFGGIGGW
jgi:hypothetical protein